MGPDGVVRKLVYLYHRITIAITANDFWVTV
jgi:hypothetical protein